MKKAMNVLFATLCAIVVGLSPGGVSFADTPACVGNEVPKRLNPICFWDESCGINMQCAPGLLTWSVSDFNTAAGNHTPRVTGFRPNGGTFSCTACARNKTGGSRGCTADVPLATVDSSAEFTVGTVNVPQAGGVFVVCTMSAGAWYLSVAF